MCGICGFIDNKKISSKILLNMTSKLRHRGPDNITTKVLDNVGLGHARLSIIDLSPSANQPISNEDNTIWLTYNGEFYTFKKYRKELLTKGHKFKSKTDSEVIIHLYEEYGIAFLKKLRGMFAFAIWDSKKGKLFLVRDRVGIKPLYYYFNGEKIVFASEIKSILEYPGIKKELSFESLNYFFTLGYIPKEKSIFKKIKKIEPAHYLEFVNNKISIKRYWSLPSSIIYSNEHEAEKKLESLLLESIKMRMISDVPLGVLLSGGVDSSLVASIMAHHSEKPIKTFSIRFKNDKFNEIKHARKIANHINSEHHEFEVDLNKADIIDDLMYYYDEPFADSSAIPTYYVSKMARKNVKVVLSGDGGDELFAGYNWYRWMYQQNYFNSLPPNVLKLSSSLSKKIPFKYKGKHFIDVLGLNEFDTFLERTSFFSKNQLDLLLNRNMQSEIYETYHNAYYTNGNSLLERLTKTDFLFYLPDDILTKIDRASMAVSLETRVPLLDHKLCEFAFSLNDNLKINMNHYKYLLKKVAKKWLPKDFNYSRKQGFSIPQSEWLKEKYYDQILELLKNDIYLNKNYVVKLANEHKYGKQNHSKKLWPILIFLSWSNYYAIS